MSISSTHLVAAQNLDKTGYSGAVTDKTGYQITANTDKTDYQCTAMADKTAYQASAVTDKSNYGVSSMGDKTGYQASAVTDKTGYQITANTDKAGYTLTAGSYSVRASSCQRVVLTISAPNTAQTASIASVTTTRTDLFGGDTAVSSTNPDLAKFARVLLVNSENVQATRYADYGGTESAINVEELF
jgi:hypothetical protein